MKGNIGSLHHKIKQNIKKGIPPPKQKTHMHLTTKQRKTRPRQKKTLCLRGLGGQPLPQVQNLPRPKPGAAREKLGAAWNQPSLLSWEGENEHLAPSRLGINRPLSCKTCPSATCLMFCFFCLVFFLGKKEGSAGNRAARVGAPKTKMGRAFLSKLKGKKSNLLPRFVQMDPWVCGLGPTTALWLPENLKHRNRRSAQNPLIDCWFYPKTCCQGAYRPSYHHKTK